MIDREELLSELEKLSEEKFRIFNEKIVHTSGFRVIGVRMPDLKAIAKKQGQITKSYLKCRMTALKR